MPTIMVLWELSEDEAELLRLWRLLGEAPVHVRQDGLDAFRECAEECGLPGVEDDEDDEAEPVDRMVNYVAVRDLQAAAPFPDDDDLLIPEGVPIL